MRLLSIGFPLPNVAIDNYNPLTAPSYNDYDVLFIDPASIDRTVRELVDGGKEFEAVDGRPIINGSTSASAVGAADQLRRRNDETRLLLESGGLVVVFARPDAVQAGLLGFEGCDRYHWLPAPAAVSWGPPMLKPAEGKTVRIRAEDHPFTEVLRQFRKETTSRAVFDDRLPEVRRHGRVIATGGASVPIAMDFEVLAGHVVFLPVIAESSTNSRSSLAQAIIDASRRLSGAAFEQPAPRWASSLAIPGLEQVEAELEEAESAAAAANSHATAVRERHDSLARHRRLLWEDGRAYAGAVNEALRMVGFTVTSGPLDPLVVESEGRPAFVEVESDRDQVVEWPYIRLQRRLEEHLLKTGEALKGVVIANGHREKDPDEREAEVSAPLVTACTNYRYSLLTARTLFELTRRVLGNADERAMLGVRRRIMEGSGALESADLFGESAGQESEAGPIF